MIKAVLVINNHGQARLIKFYDVGEGEPLSQAARQDAIREVGRRRFEREPTNARTCARRHRPQVFALVSKRPENVCNFIEESRTWGKDIRLIYRHYATLYFVFAVDESESELGILDLIQVGARAQGMGHACMQPSPRLMLGAVMARPAMAMDWLWRHGLG
jgi:AP-3 complex subunit sigma